MQEPDSQTTETQSLEGAPEHGVGIPARPRAEAPAVFNVGHSITTKCPSCDGTGLWPDNFDGLCCDCKGKGYRTDEDEKRIESEGHYE